MYCIIYYPNKLITFAPVGTFVFLKGVPIETLLDHRYSGPEHYIWLNSDMLKCQSDATSLMKSLIK